MFKWWCVKVVMKSVMAESEILSGFIKKNYFKNVNSSRPLNLGYTCFNTFCQYITEAESLKQHKSINHQKLVCLLKIGHIEAYFSKVNSVIQPNLWNQSNQNNYPNQQSQSNEPYLTDQPKMKNFFGWNFFLLAIGLF